jgi:hypothetical protein
MALPGTRRTHNTLPIIMAPMSLFVIRSIRAAVSASMSLE